MPSPQRFTFPREARLAESGAFARLKREGRTFPGRYLVLSVLEVPGEEGRPTRLGIITSRRVGGAVQRSRARRLCREAFRLSRPSLRPGFWLVFIVRAPAALATQAQLQAEWLKLAQRAGLLPRPTSSGPAAPVPSTPAPSC